MIWIRPRSYLFFFPTVSFCVVHHDILCWVDMRLAIWWMEYRRLILLFVPIAIADAYRMDQVYFSPTNGLPSESKLATYMVSFNFPRHLCYVVLWRDVWQVSVSDCVSVYYVHLSVCVRDLAWYARGCEVGSLHVRRVHCIWEFVSGFQSKESWRKCCAVLCCVMCVVCLHTMYFIRW